MDDETRVELFQMALISANLFGKLIDFRRNDCATTKQLQICFGSFLLYDGDFKFCLKLSGRYDDAEAGGAVLLCTRGRLLLFHPFCRRHVTSVYKGARAAIVDAFRPHCDMVSRR